jgi:hypothetical protein
LACQRFGSVREVVHNNHNESGRNFFSQVRVSCSRNHEYLLRKMPITTLETKKTASRPQPAPDVESTTKRVENSITVLSERLETTNNANEALWPAPSQKATTTRLKRAHTTEPPTPKINEGWSEEEDENDTAFHKSSIIARTPTQQCCTPPDASVIMAPKKKETALLMKFRDVNAPNTTAHTHKQNNEVNITSPSENLIEALKKVQHILSQNSIKKEEKSDASQTISLAIKHIIETNKKLEEHYNPQGKQSPSEDNARLRNIEEQLEKLTKAITEPTQTYAQAVQRNTVKKSAGNHSIHTENRIKERTEKLKRERAKTEVIITTRNANEETKDQLKKMSEETLMNTLQQAITVVGTEQVKIRRVQKTANQGIKIRCTTDKEAKELRNMNWEKIIEGASIIETLYQVVIHGVSKYDIDFTKDNPEEIITRMRDSNSKGTNVEKVEPLTKRPKNPNAPTQSIIISFKCPKEADACIETGIHIEQRHYAIAERYIPQSQIKQCFKCQAYGHKANVCTRKARCGKCAQEHETKETMTCANCKGSHCAWFHECPIRQQKREQGAILRNQLSDFYTS